MARSALRAEVARLFEQHLDRDRPLWRIDALALDDGATALVWRLHHALADGTASMRFARAMLWDAVPAAEPLRRTRPRGGRRAPTSSAARRTWPRSCGASSPLGGAVAVRRAHRPPAADRVRLACRCSELHDAAARWPARR